MRTKEAHTMLARIEEFLNDVYSQIKDGDDMPRTLYTAMTYHLTGLHSAALHHLGILEREGWRWKWKGGAPNTRMAQRVRDHAYERMIAYGGRASKKPSPRRSKI